MSEEKAYKILAKQKNISNNEAKELIDSGLVYAKGQKVMIAAGLLMAIKFSSSKITLGFGISSTLNLVFSLISARAIITFCPLA